MKSKNRWMLVLSVIGLVGLDWLTKYLFYNKAIWSDSRIFEPVFNEGISRGISMNLFFVIVVSILALLMFCYMYQRKYTNLLITSLLIAGTMGNMLDRIFLGGVRDFISLGNFPVFNFADVYLTIGVIILVIYEVFGLQKKKKTVK